MSYSSQHPSVLSPVDPSLHLTENGSPKSTLFLPPVGPSSFGSPTSAMAAPIPISRPVSRGTTPSLSRHNSQRHHPYSASPASFAGAPLFRSRSATSASDCSEWDSEASVATYSLYGSSVDSYCTTPATSCDTPSMQLPVPPSTSAGFEESPFVVGRQPRIGKGGRPVKSHTRKLEPGHIKRPPNAFILFRSHCCQPDASESLDPSAPEPPATAHARHLASLEINNSQHISVIVSQVWKGLSARDKSYWEDKARVAKEEHQRLHPDYKYRPQQRLRDSSGKKKRKDTRDVNEHREACNEVARQVLEIERERRRRNGSAENEDDDALEQTAPPPGPKKKKSPRATRASARSTRSKAKAKASTVPQYPSPEGIFDLELPDHRTAVDSTVFLAPFEAPSRPHTAHGYTHQTVAPVDVPPSLSPQHVSAQVLNSPEGQFSYMTQLDAFFAQTQSLPSSTPLSIDPRLASAPTSRPATALAQQSSFEPVFSNPFASPPPSSAPKKASTFVLPNPQSPSRPATAAPSASPFKQLQGYTLGGDLPPVPCTANPDVPVSPFEARFAQSERPAPLAIDALKQRRGTLRASTLNAGRGDLMLMQPVTTMYNGRRRSIGWNTGVRRLSATPMGQLGDEAPATRRAPTFASSALAGGVLSATETFETFSFPQGLVESLPTEEPDVTAEFFAQFSSAVPITGLFDAEGLPENSRPSTADSDWSDAGAERLDFDLPAQYPERRRSTLVPSKLATALSTVSPPSPSGYHVGSTDFFMPPPSALSTAPTSAVASPGPSEAPYAYTAAEHFSPDVPSGITVNADDWLSGVAANMHVTEEAASRGVALSVIQERLLQQQQQETSQLISGMTTSSEPSMDCEYVFLTMEQLQDAELMAKIHRHGFGIAFEPAPADPSFPSTSSVDAGSTEIFADSPNHPHSATF
ncbi:specific transcriptional repressor [Rhodotorula toruloides]|uniref:Specific transcriptional repressor n=1 Tax=Rhodotorula toruloides TaxID=5286 RepID=A0A511K8C2_RHOTO|nr:specific transcriptional repressor [Rhodotorula toruloides]